MGIEIMHVRLLFLLASAVVLGRTENAETEVVNLWKRMEDLGQERAGTAEDAIAAATGAVPLDKDKRYSSGRNAAYVSAYGSAAAEATEQRQAQHYASANSAARPTAQSVQEARWTAA